MLRASKVYNGAIRSSLQSKQPLGTIMTKVILIPFQPFTQEKLTCHSVLRPQSPKKHQRNPSFLESL